MKKIIPVLLSSILAVVMIAATAFGCISSLELQKEVDDAQKVADLNTTDAANAIDNVKENKPSNPAFAAAMIQLSALQDSTAALAPTLSKLKTTITELEGLITKISANIPKDKDATIVNVCDFGAIPGDDKDDTIALQNAIDAVKDGGTVYFPTGVYRLTLCLVFYSNQCLFFENGAVLFRDSETLTYLLANRTYGTEGEYSATENVDIIGATFDGNASINYKITMMNTGHCRNIRLTNCTFRNGNGWHYFECNSSEYVTIENCVFENSYKNAGGTAEFLQFDYAKSGAYGIIKSVFGSEAFKFDETVCRYIEVKNCYFDTTGVACTAIGNHSNAAHHNIKIHDNVFVDNNTTDARGIIYFVSKTNNVEIYSNTFFNAKTGVQVANSTATSIVRNNRFEGVSTPFTGAVIGYENVINGVLTK